MKSNKIMAITAALILGLATISYAGYIRGYKVTALEDNGVTIQKGDTEPVKVRTNSKNFAIGDKVDFDAKRGKLRRDQLESIC